MLNSFIAGFIKEEDGQDLVEYSLLLSFIGLAAVAVLTTVKVSVQDIWTTVNSKLSDASSAAGTES